MFVLVSKSEQKFVFPRRFRLTRREGFSHVLHQKPQFNRWFSIHALPNNLSFSRLGVSISKRVIAGAVQRNMIKRMVRECFRHHGFHVDNQDVVIRLRKSLDKQELVTRARSIVRVI